VDEQNETCSDFDVSVVGLGAMGTIMAQAYLRPSSSIGRYLKYSPAIRCSFPGNKHSPLQPCSTPMHLPRWLYFSRPWAQAIGLARLFREQPDSCSTRHPFSSLMHSRKRYAGSKCRISRAIRRGLMCMRACLRTLLNPCMHNVPGRQCSTPCVRSCNARNHWAMAIQKIAATTQVFAREHGAAKEA